MNNPFAFLFNSSNQIQLNSEAPTPMPKNFVFDEGTFERSYRRIHGNCKCDTCIHDMMRAYVRQVLVQPTSYQKLKDRIDELIKGAEEDIHNKRNNESILNNLLDKLRIMT